MATDGRLLTVRSRVGIDVERARSRGGFAAELLFTFVLGYVVFSCIESPRDAPNTLWHFAICVAVVAGTVDFAALFGGVFLVSQVIAGAFTAIAFLIFGAAAR